MNVDPRRFDGPAYRSNNDLPKPGLVVGIGCIGCQAVDYQKLFHKSHLLNYLAMHVGNGADIDMPTSIDTIDSHETDDVYAEKAGLPSILEKLEAWMTLYKSNFIFFLLELGDPVCDALSIAAVRLCKEKYKTVSTILSIPNGTINNSMEETTMTVLRTLQQTADATMFFFKDDLSKQPNNGSPSHFLSELVNQSFYEPFAVLQNILQQKGIVVLDSKDILLMLEGNKCVGVSMVKTDKSNWPEELFLQTMASHYMKYIETAGPTRILLNIESSRVNEPTMDKIEALCDRFLESFTTVENTFLGIGIDESLDNWTRLTCLVTYPTLLTSNPLAQNFSITKIVNSSSVSKEIIFSHP